MILVISLDECKDNKPLVDLFGAESLHFLVSGRVLRTLHIKIVWIQREQWECVASRIGNISGNRGSGTSGKGILSVHSGT